VVQLLSLLQNFNIDGYQIIFSGGTCLSKAHKNTFRMSEDIDVINAKNELSEAKGPFNDAKTVLEFKISYLYLLVEEKGGALYDEE